MLEPRRRLHGDDQLLQRGLPGGRHLRLAPAGRALTLAAGLAATGLALSLTGASAEADPPASRPKPGVIVLGADPGLPRPFAQSPRVLRLIDRARARLDACSEVAFAEDPTLGAEVEAAVKVAPNGEVTGVDLTPRGHVADAGLACFRRALGTLALEPASGAGWVVRVTLVLGDPPRGPAPRLPLGPVNADGAPREGPFVLRFAAPPATAAVRALRSVLGIAAKCAASAPPAGPAVVSTGLLVSDAGELAGIEATSAAPGEALARCIGSAPVIPPRGRLTRVEVALSVAPDGGVSVVP